MSRQFKICLEWIWGSWNEMQKQLYFFYIGGSAPPQPPGWGAAPDPVFLYWHRVHVEFINQITKLNTNWALTLVNITILMWADICLLIFLSPKTGLKTKFSKPFTISSTIELNKLACKFWAESSDNFAEDMDFFYLEEIFKKSNILKIGCSIKRLYCEDKTFEILEKKLKV